MRWTIGGYRRIVPPRSVTIPAGAVSLFDARRGTTRAVEVQAFEIAVTPATVAGSRRPLTGITWLEAIEAANAAAEADGLQPAYRCVDGRPWWDPRADGWRLPTEAEWVHAAAAGAATPTGAALRASAWTADDGLDGPPPVAAKAANAFGVFDALGTVWEWVWDPIDPARYGDYRTLKGGGWADPAWSARIGTRRGSAPNARIDDVGFRLARGAVGGVDADGAPWAQGWSAAEDARRAAISGPLPVGWTPALP